MANLNKVFLIGNMTRDPELRYTPSGTAVADFGLAINRNFTSQGGEKREETCFVDCQIWARGAEVISEYCHKGSSIFVEGRLKLDQWEGKDGQKRSRIRVVVENFQFLGSPTGRKGGGEPQERAGGRGKAMPSTRGGSAEHDESVPSGEGEAHDIPYKVDDDIPF